MTGGDEKRCTPSQTRPTEFPLQTIIKARTMPTRQSTSTEQLVPALTHFSINKRGEKKKKMPSKLLKSKFPVIKRLLFLFFFFSRFNENLPSPHTALLFQSVLLKQRTGSRSSHAWACGAPQSPRWPVWSGSWRALWRGRGGSPRSTSG